MDAGIHFCKLGSKAVIHSKSKTDIYANHVLSICLDHASTLPLPCFYLSPGFQSAHLRLKVAHS